MLENRSLWTLRTDLAMKISDKDEVETGKDPEEQLLGNGRKKSPAARLEELLGNGRFQYFQVGKMFK